MIGQHLIEKDTNERAILAAAAGHVKGGGLIFYSKTDADGDFTTFIVTDELPTTPMPREHGETSTLRTIFGSNGRGTWLANSRRLRCRRNDCHGRTDRSCRVQQCCKWIQAGVDAFRSHRSTLCGRRTALVTDSALTDAAMTADLEWLLESGLVFDPYEKGHESLALPDAVSDMRALFEQKLLDRSAAHIMGGAPLVTARTSCTGRRLRPE